MKEITAIISIRSRGTAVAVPTKETRERIAAEFDIGQLMWLPPDVVTFKGAGFSVSGGFFIFLAGVVFSALLKPIINGVLEEAGKDVWTALKRVICRTRLEQAKASYTVNGDAYIVFEIQDEYVALRIPLPNVSSADQNPERALEAAVSDRFQLLARDWDAIQETVKKFDVGKLNGLGSSRTGFHVIDQIWSDPDSVLTIKADKEIGNRSSETF